MLNIILKKMVRVAIWVFILYSSEINMNKSICYTSKNSTTLNPFFIKKKSYWIKWVNLHYLYSNTAVQLLTNVRAYCWYTILACKFIQLHLYTSSVIFQKPVSLSFPNAMSTTSIQIFIPSLVVLTRVSASSIHIVWYQKTNLSVRCCGRSSMNNK